MKIGHLSTFYHTAVILMAGKDIGQYLGADVQWRLFGTGPDIINAFKRDELDLAYIGLPPAVIGIDRGVGIKCIAGGHVEGTVISAKGQYRGFPEIKDLFEVLKQFCGLKIGVPGKGSIHDVIITQYLDSFDLKKEIQVVNFRWADQITEALVRGEVSAVVGTPALATAVKRYAGGKVLYPPSKLWPDNPSYGIIVSAGLLREGKEMLERFLLLHEDATYLLRHNPVEAARIISGYIGFVDQEFVMETLEISPKYCAQLTDNYISSTMRFVEALIKLGYIKRKITSDEIFDTSLIKKIHPSKDHYSNGIAL